MILCCGEALIDMIPAPTQGGPDGFVPHTGGAVFNTAIGLGRLGVPVGMVTGLSTDMFGAHLEAELIQSDVSTAHVIRSDRPTTLAFVQLTEGQASYAFFDENSAGRMIESSQMPQLPAHTQALFFGGISLVCEPGADAYLSLAEREAGDRVIMVDPNIRTGFITDEPRYRDRIDRMLRCADIVKVSDEDLAWLSLSDNLGTAVQRFQSVYDCVLCVTQGADGATAHLPSGQTRHSPALQVDVVDTVGAGDAFNAGLLASLAAQGRLSKSDLAAMSADTLERALALASRVAALTVSKPGAQPPMRSDVADLLPH